ncbi:MAG: hypothetical protein MK212_02805 [Saprospiraceae bacterium]|nr:hypothetical protein [Saprospiraceae bacterium]
MKHTFPFHSSKFILILSLITFLGVNIKAINPNKLLSTKTVPRIEIYEDAEILEVVKCEKAKGWVAKIRLRLYMKDYTTGKETDVARSIYQIDACISIAYFEELKEESEKLKTGSISTVEEYIKRDKEEAEDVMLLLRATHRKLAKNKTYKQYLAGKKSN